MYSNELTRRLPSVVDRVWCHIPTNRSAASYYRVARPTSNGFRGEGGAHIARLRGLRTAGTVTAEPLSSGHEPVPENCTLSSRFLWPISIAVWRVN